MRLMRFSESLGAVFLALSFIAGSTSTVGAQSSVTSADIQRLQDNIYNVSRDVTELGSRDSAMASQLQTELDAARDEATYLKVKLSRNESISRSDYDDVRDRIESIRSRAHGDAPKAYTPADPNRAPDSPAEPDRRDEPDGRPNVAMGRAQNPNEIPVGTEFDVRLQTPLSSRTAQVEDRFDATTMVDLRNERNRVMVPAGSVMRGIVSSVNRATRLDRKGSMTVEFDRVTIGGRSHPIRATVTQAIESEGIGGEKEKIGIGAGAGAILGAILGGAKGALAGILIGGGGTIAATEGNDVELSSGTVLRVRLDSPLDLRW